MNRKKATPWTALLLALVLALTGCGGKPAAQSEALSAPVYIPRSLPCPLPLETVTWGGMLSLSEKALLSGAWWIILIPGGFLVAALLCITSLGSCLRRNINRRENNLY